MHFNTSTFSWFSSLNWSTRSHGRSFARWMSLIHFWSTGCTRMDCQRHYSQAMESNLHLTSFRVYVSSSILWMWLPRQFTLRPMDKWNNTCGLWHRCCNVMWTIISGTGMRTLPQSRKLTTVRYAVLLTLVNLIWCSSRRSRTSYCNLRYLVEQSIPLPNNVLNFKLYYESL